MRVERSFAFIDLSGFTSYTDEFGDERAVEVLSLFRAAVRAAASDQAVRVAKWLGDGAMLVGVEHPHLLTAVLDLIHKTGLPLPLRAGVSVGDVILIDGEDYTGGPVNLAARLCDAARPHELLATPEAARMMPPWAEAIQFGERTVPGFHHTVNVVALRPADLTQGATPASGE
jgi:class 3 adenylate cyclase